MSCPPLLGLQVYGLCCPFIESEEERDARNGAHNLQNYPIVWYRQKLLTDVVHDVKGVLKGTRTTGFIHGVVDKVEKIFSGGGTRNDTNPEIPMTYVGVPALLNVLDTQEQGPVIQVQQMHVQDSKLDPHQLEVPTNKMDQDKQAELPSKTIPLYLVDTVSAGWSLMNDSTAGGVKLFAKPSSKGLLSGTGQELLRFDTLGGRGNILTDSFFPVKTEPNKYCDEVISQLRALVEWNRSRIAKDIQAGRSSVAQTSHSSYEATN